MFDALFLTLVKSKYTWITLAIVVVGVWVYSLYTKNQQLEAERRTLQQNTAFVTDSLSKMKDSVQTISVKVGNLQIESDEWRGKYLAISTRYQISLDTIKVLKKRVFLAQIIGDSIGIVPFEGMDGIASYKGQTQINIKSGEGSYSIQIAFSDIETQAEMFYDEVDKLWKIRTVSLSPGVKLRGLSTIDNETFRKISEMKEALSKTPHSFAVGGVVATDRVYGGIVFAPSQWMFGVNYKFFDKSSTPGESWTDKIAVSVHYWIW